MPTSLVWMVYKEIVGELLVTVARVREGLGAIGGIDIVGEPIGPLLALKSDNRRPLRGC